jgi:hypothetical protein
MVNVVRNKVLTQPGLMKCLLLLVKAADGLVVSGSDLETLPKDEAIGVKYDAETDSFELKCIKAEARKIVTPSLILPR